MIFFKRQWPWTFMCRTVKFCLKNYPRILLSTGMYCYLLETVLLFKIVCYCLDSLWPSYLILGISKELKRNCVKITYSAFMRSLPAQTHPVVLWFCEKNNDIKHCICAGSVSCYSQLLLYQCCIVWVCFCELQTSVIKIAAKHWSMCCVLYLSFNQVLKVACCLVESTWLT